MYSTNILSEDGLESVLWLTATRWNETAYGLGLEGPVESGAQSAVGDEPTLFRVWTSGYGRPGIPDDPDSGPATLWRAPLPLTEAARSASESGSARTIALALIPVAMLGEAGRAVEVVIGIGRFAVHVDAVNLDLRPVRVQSAQYVNLVTHR